MAQVNQTIWNQVFTTQNGELTLSSLDSDFIVLYFYPKDNTPGCSNEAQDFNQLLSQFTAKGASVVGASRDSVASHQRFVEKFDLQFPLISDPDETLCRALDVIKEKNMFGKKGFGIERSTFILDREGHILKEWRKVKVAGHATEVLEALSTLK